METTYTEAALGFRVWRVRDDQLASIGHGEVVWRPGINVAYCAQHRAPKNDCLCGLYAFHELSELQDFQNAEELLLGAIASRGHLEVHHDGFRAEEAVLLGLVPSSQIAADKLTRIAEEYRVPLITYDRLSSWAEQYAHPVPVAERPATAQVLDPPQHAPVMTLPQLIFQLTVVLLLMAAALLMGMVWWLRVPFFTLTLITLVETLIIGHAIPASARLQHRLKRVIPVTWIVLGIASLVFVGHALNYTDNQLSGSAGTQFDQELRAYYRLHHQWPNISTLSAYQQVLIDRPGLLVFPEGKCLRLAWEQTAATPVATAIDGVVTERICPPVKAPATTTTSARPTTSPQQRAVAVS